jgi:hypothetical protein
MIGTARPHCARLIDGNSLANRERGQTRGKPFARLGFAPRSRAERS